MPRYMVERVFDEGLEIPMSSQGAELCARVVANNATEGVTWIRSFVTDDHRKTYCLYDGPSPEAIRQAAAQSQLPVDGIFEVAVLDPYFYSPAASAAGPNSGEGS